MPRYLQDVNTDEVFEVEQYSTRLLDKVLRCYYAHLVGKPDGLWGIWVSLDGTTAWVATPSEFTDAAVEISNESRDNNLTDDDPNLVFDILNRHTAKSQVREVRFDGEQFVPKSIKSNCRATWKSIARW